MTTITAKRHFLSQWIAEYYADLGRELTGHPTVVPIYKWIVRPKNITQRTQRDSDGKTILLVPEPAPYFEFVAYASTGGREGVINSYQWHIIKKCQLTLRELCILMLRVCGEWDLSDDNYNIK